MKKPKIVFYCSWGGFGHVARSFSIISQLPKGGRYVVATPEDWPFNEPSKNFHYQKLHKPKSRIRLYGEELKVQNYIKNANDTEGYKKHLHQFINLLEKESPDLVLVDNPAEVSLISKILGYKTAVMYESLDTDDLRWRMAWKSADILVTPYTKSFMETIKFPHIEKADCVGGFSRFEANQDALKTSQKEAKERLGWDLSRDYIVMTLGKGETAESLILKIIDNLKTKKEIILLYPNPGKKIKELEGRISNLKVTGGVFEEMYLYLAAADFIITGAGYNSVMEAFLYRKPTVSIPLSNIYNEQILKAKALDKMGALKYVNPDKPERINKALKWLRKEKNKKKMSKAQKEMVDKKGAKRAAETLIKNI